MKDEQTKTTILIALSLLLMGIGNFFHFEGDLLFCAVGGFILGYNFIKLIIK